MNAAIAAAYFMEFGINLKILSCFAFFEIICSTFWNALSSSNFLSSFNSFIRSSPF